MRNKWNSYDYTNRHTYKPWSPVRRAIKKAWQAFLILLVVVGGLALAIAFGVAVYHWNEAMYGDGSCAFKRCVQVHQGP